MKKALSLLFSSFVALNLATSVITNAAALEDESFETATDSTAVTDDVDIQTTTTTEATATETTTVTTENNNDETFTYDFTIRVVDISNEYVYVPNVNLRLVEYDAGYSYEDKSANEKLKIKTIAEWNTSDANPMVITYPDTHVDHFYVVESDDLPENYCYDEKKAGYVEQAYTGDYLNRLTSSDDYWTYLIRLYNEPPCEVWDTFPKTVSPEFTVNFFDYTEYVTDIKNVENIPDIDVEIVEAFENENGGFTLGDVIGNYNTSDGEISFKKECTFNSLNDCVYFGVKTSNLPDHYTHSHDTLWYNDGHVDEYKIISFSAYYIRTRDTNRDIVLRKYNAPIYTTVTTPYPSEITTTTTTTTTAVTTTETTTEDETDKTTTSTTEITSTTASATETTTTTDVTSETETTTSSDESTETKTTTSATDENTKTESTSTTTETTVTTVTADETSETTTTATGELPETGFGYSTSDVVKTASMMIIAGAAVTGYAFFYRKKDEE